MCGVDLDHIVHDDRIAGHGQMRVAVLRPHVHLELGIPGPRDPHAVHVHIERRVGDRTDRGSGAPIAGDRPHRLRGAGFERGVDRTHRVEEQVVRCATAGGTLVTRVALSREVDQNSGIGCRADPPGHAGVATRPGHDGPIHAGEQIEVACASRAHGADAVGKIRVEQADEPRHALDVLLDDRVGRVEPPLRASPAVVVDLHREDRSPRERIVRGEPGERCDAVERRQRLVRRPDGNAVHQDRGRRWERRRGRRGRGRRGRRGRRRHRRGRRGRRHRRGRRRDVDGSEPIGTVAPRHESDRHTHDRQDHDSDSAAHHEATTAVHVGVDWLAHRVRR